MINNVGKVPGEQGRWHLPGFRCLGFPPLHLPATGELGLVQKTVVSTLPAKERHGGYAAV